MRPEVSNLVSKGPVPSAQGGVPQIKEWQEAFEKIKPPISDDEAKALIGLFPASDDDCFGLAWSLIHVVETCPHWPLRECLQDTDKPWLARLRQRSSK
jgi:hypothetical protein